MSYKQLEKLFAKLSHLDHIHSYMSWDEAVMMPQGGGDTRAQAMATFSEIKHNLLIDPKTHDLLEAAKEEDHLNAWQQANLFWMEKQYKQQTTLPLQLVKSLVEASIKSEQAWRQYRAENNWQDYAPYLEEVFKLAKEATNIRAEKEKLSAYDLLIDDFSPSLSQKIIDPVFIRLKQELPHLIELIIEKQKDDRIIEPIGPFDTRLQNKIGVELMEAIGFDFAHGRLDTSHHPFCGGTPDDIRMTTRYVEDQFSFALMGICHETGHAMYEQHLPQEWRHQPVGSALGMTVHESQSLLIEMQACRSNEYMHFLSKKLINYFGQQDAFTPDNLFKYHTRVERSLIRVDADEVTYPLHVILRYDIEKDLFEGGLQISDLPEIWNAKMSDYLGITTHNDYKNGVMQDVHWPSGAFGYFPAYTLGRLLAAQLFNQAKKDHPTITANLHEGNFLELNAWLQQNIHERASSVSFETLVKDATGESLNADYFIKHVKSRYLDADD